MNAVIDTSTKWHLRSRTLSLGRQTLVVGIVNITPDSFSDGGHFLDAHAAISHALALVDEGADLLDLGAESTRPHAHPVSAEEEQARLLPVVRGILAERPGTILSVDTYKASTARAALAAGAEIINDVSGFLWDPAMPLICAESQCGVVLSHTRGRPEQWHMQPQLDPDKLLSIVTGGLRASLRIATQAGIATQQIIFDPGYGFGKKQDENYALLARQRELLALGRPLMAGLSRKSFLGHTLAPLYNWHDAPVNARESASLAAMVIAILNGASMVRVHNVRHAVEAARIADALLAAHPVINLDGLGANAG